MSMYPNAGSKRYELDYATDDRALGSFFNAVYAWMAVGLALTAVVAWFVSQTPALLQIIYAGKGAAIAFALGAFAIAWYVQANVLRISTALSTGLFLLYAAIIGAMISYIFIVYSKGGRCGVATEFAGGTPDATARRRQTAAPRARSPARCRCGRAPRHGRAVPAGRFPGGAKR